MAKIEVRDRRRTTSISSATRVWLTAHRWLGLVAGLMLAVISLSGVALVFNETMVRAEAESVLFAELPLGPSRPVSEWIAKAEARYPQFAPIESVHGAGSLPIASGVPVVFKHGERDGEEIHVAIGIDPTTAEPTGFVVAEDTWAGFFLLLHVELLSGETGQLLVAITGAAAILLTVTGLYLWWAKPGRWRQAFAMRRGATGVARLLDFHNVPTLWLFAPYAAIMLTGLYLQRPAWIDPIVKPFSAIRELQNIDGASSTPGTCAEQTSIDKAIELARQGRDPAEVIKTIWRPSGPSTPYYIELRSPDANPRTGGTVVWVDRNCPRIVSVRDYADLTGAETLKSWLWPIHTNLALGFVGQALVFAVGVLTTGLFVTGVLLWLRRRRVR